MMQHHPGRVSYSNQDNFHDNQYPLINQPPSETGNINQSYSEPPSYAQHSQQLSNGIDHIAPSAQHNGEAPLYREPDNIYVTANQSSMRTGVSTIMTSKLQAFFMISGIFYFLLGGAAIGLEIAIIMYSHSVYYRGIWIGAAMLGLGINTFIVACRVSYSMSHMLPCLASAFIVTICGIGFTGLDLGFTKLCSDRSSESLCERQIAVKLKIALLIELSICTIHIGINLVVANRMQKRSVSKPLARSA